MVVRPIGYRHRLVYVCRIGHCEWGPQFSCHDVAYNGTGFCDLFDRRSIWCSVVLGQRPGGHHHVCPEFAIDPCVQRNNFFRTKVPGVFGTLRTDVLHLFTDVLLYVN